MNLTARYRDYEHKNTKLLHSNLLVHERFIEDLDNDYLLRLQYDIQVWLEDTAIVPKVYKLHTTASTTVLWEEFIHGKNVSELLKTERLFHKIGATIKLYHSKDVNSMPQELYKRVSNDYLNEDGSYNPINIFEAFFEEAVINAFSANKIRPNDRHRIDSIRTNASLILDAAHSLFTSNSNTNPVLIHADLSLSNIMVEAATEDIKIVDWVDARLDSPSCDLSHFLWLSNSTPILTDAFLAGYNAPWINKRVLQVHYLLNNLYEIGRSLALSNGLTNIDQKWLEQAENLILQWDQTIK